MTPSKNQITIYKAFQDTDANINISAVAGSGKTTVLLELLKFVPEHKSAIFLAFNNSIINELKERSERKDVDIMTLHSYGWRMILSRYGGKVKMNPNKAISKIEKVIKKFEEIRENKKGYYFYIIPKIVDLMRCNLVESNIEVVTALCEQYDLNVGETEVNVAIEVFELMNKDKNQFDFMDMIYQPAVDTTLRFRKFDYVFCDESQDFSLAQHAIIKNCLNRRGRLITVGDERQAIYGFAGADAGSYSKLSALNGAAIKLPLSVSYRCAISVVKEAQKIVPEISWAPNAKEGSVRDGSLTELEYGDWILCRNLKPLIQTYLWLMKNKIKSKVRGKDIGEGILLLISKTGAKSIGALLRMMDIEQDKLYRKLESRGFRNPLMHPKMEALMQRIEVIGYLCGEVDNVKQLTALIEDIFSDEVKGILLSTIHKAKGLENDTIFFLCPELIPSKFATLPWQLEQEQNLKYVGITRARENLIYVNGSMFLDDITSNVIIQK